MTVEIVLFKLNANVAESDFLSAVAAMTPDLRTVSGYLSRELLRGDDGLWVDVLHWRSMADAQQAMATMMSKPSMQPFMAMLDGSSMEMRHYEETVTYGAADDQTGLTVEMVLGRLLADADAVQFVPAAQATNQDLAGLPGFLDRELSMTEGGEWADLVHWRSRAEALAAMEHFPNLPGAQAFGALMDGENMRMLHLERVLVA